jgi:hypothetical protein
MIGVLIVFGIIIALITPAPLIAHALSIAVLEPTPPVFTDLNGDSTRWVTDGQQVVITTTFRNALEEEIAFVGILEVRDANGITVLLAWQSNIVEPSGNKTIGISWVAENSTCYQSRTFAVTDFENPQVLSPVESSEACTPTG